MKTIRILGIRGVPAAHGGFETFAEYLSLYLVERDWEVIVYCQESQGSVAWEDEWCGVKRVHVPVSQAGPLGTVIFDWRSIVHASARPGLCLTLGYNTAVFCALLRARGLTNVINMDGIEWARAKWGRLAKMWFWVNDWAGCWLGNHLIADHPEIGRHLSTRSRASKITTIAYGAERITSASDEYLARWGLQPGQYLTLVARAEPENSILEVVQGFSRKSRGKKLIVLGEYSRSHAYQRAVLEAASGEVIFVGAIYEKPVVQALRFHSAAYIHGHQVGGTNPSLVEALGAGNAIIAHNNRFNRWVAGPSARYFTDADSLSDILDEIMSGSLKLEELRAGSLRQFESEFTWPHILGQYEALLSRFFVKGKSKGARERIGSVG